MNNVMKKLYDELFSGWSNKEMVYGWSLVALQVLFYVVYPDSLWGFIAGTTGTICVLLVAKGKISNYFFGFIQTGIMVVLGFNAGLIGEPWENVFYFVTQFWGIYEWKKNMVKEEQVVKTRKLTIKQWVLLIIGIIVVTMVFGSSFEYFAGTQPYLDSLTLVLAIFAQMLMVYRFREQWLLWGILNIVSIYQWFTLGDMSLVALYVALLINTVYGYGVWSKHVAKLEDETLVSIEPIS